MWKNRIQNSGSNRTSAQTKSSNLSPFASHSSVDSVGTSSSTSPKTGTELPSGVRYIRQTPAAAYRAVTGRTPSPSVAKSRERSPEKTLRFADPLMCTKKHERTDNTLKTIIKGRSASKERSRNLIRPVISTDTNSGECKRFSSHNQKTIATSPATGQTSPIFSSVDFGGDKRTTTSTMTSNENQINSRNDVLNDSPDSVADTTPKLTHDRQPVIKTEIKTPNGTVLKRSSAVTSKTVNNGTIHRNTVSFPIQASSDRNVEQSRLSVNVNVAVGLDCNDNRMNHFVDRKYYNERDTELNAINQNEDEVDWQPVADPDSGFALKVAVRLRPFVESEINSRNNIRVIEMNGNTVRIVRSDNDNYNRMEYAFNVCLNSSDRDLFDYADQDTVFKKMGKPLLDRALEGYNVCLFAYGQTGSGKSFTITGSDTNPGIIPRFVHELYKRMLNLTEVLFAVEVSYCEIYNEKIYDLLSDDKNYNKKILRIREHPQTGPYVENLNQITVEDYEEVMHLLSSGNRRRATASTAANADSSRSHSIFTIILSQLKNNCDEMGLDMSCSCGSRINLIDLAGSERVGISSTSGDRLKEGSLINKSLLNLGKVITKLADYSAHPDRRTHIPYRDSALTWLLRESLGGNSQTSMIATISPAKCHLEETLSTLRYASTASRIVNFVHINEDPKSKKIRELMEIIAELKEKQKQNTNDVNNKMNTEVITSTDSSTDSQTSPQSVIKISRATNTSFVSSPQTDFKGTDTSFTDKVVEHPKKRTTSIATNTSFIKPPQTCSTGTEAPKINTSTKPKTVSTATEMSFIEQIDTSTNTAFVELPSRLDLLRFQKLEEQQKKLIEDIRRHKEKILGEVTSKVEEWSHVGCVRPHGSEEEKSDTISDNYFDCEDIETNESIASNKTFVLSKDTVDQTPLWTTSTTTATTTTVVTSEDTIQEEKPSDKKKDKKDKKKKKKDKEKDKSNEWTAEQQNKSEIKSNEKTEEYDWNKDNDWRQEVNQTSNEKVDNQSNEWSVDPNEEQKASKPTTDEWGTDTQNSDNWETQQTDEYKDNETEIKNKSEEDNNWGTDDNNVNQTQDNNTGDDWNDNQWSTEEPAKTDKTKEENNDWGDWGTDAVDNSTEKNDNCDNKETEESFDWGSDPIDTTVIDTQEVKKESTDNWDTTEENW